jgi:hypothetical protein
LFPERVYFLNLRSATGAHSSLHLVCDPNKVDSNELDSCEVDSCEVKDLYPLLSLLFWSVIPAGNLLLAPSLKSRQTLSEAKDLHLPLFVLLPTPCLGHAAEFFVRIAYERRKSGNCTLTIQTVNIGGSQNPASNPP